MSTFSFTVAIAGVTIRFSSPRLMEIPLELRPFLTNADEVQESYEIVLLEQPLELKGKPVFVSCRQAVYAEEDGSTRVFLLMKAPDGCMPACRLRSNGKNTLYLPASDWGRYEKRCKLSVILGAEALFLRHNGMILHSSVVRCHGEAVLFSGSSGAGKSTQAELWRRFRNAEILNGDRCIIVQRGDRFFGCGSPYSGSSGIYRPDEAPIRAVVLPQKASENRIVRLERNQAFRRLYREMIGNLWDVAYTEKLLDLLNALLLRVPVYCLYCRPEEQAVELTWQTVFGGK